MLANIHLCLAQQDQANSNICSLLLKTQHKAANKTHGLVMAVKIEAIFAKSPLMIITNTYQPNSLLYRRNLPEAITINNYH